MCTDKESVCAVVTQAILSSSYVTTTTTTTMTTNRITSSLLWITSLILVVLLPPGKLLCLNYFFTACVESFIILEIIVVLGHLKIFENRKGEVESKFTKTLPVHVEILCNFGC